MGKIPNLVIAGTVKGGTTSLFRYLAIHPDICASKRKETCYFLPLRYGTDLHPWAEYERMFEHYRAQRYVLEATPGYFEGGEKLAKGINARLGNDIRVIITLRNPAERLISFFRYKQAQLQLSKDLGLDAYIKMCMSMPIADRRQEENDGFWGVDGGRYMQYLPDWFSVFGKDNVKVVFFDSIEKEPRLVMMELCNWLGLDSSLYLNTNFTIENQTVQYRYAWLHGIAIKLNRRSEMALRIFPSVKRLVRRVYYRLNGSSGNRELHLSHDRALDGLYADDNHALAAFLIEQGYNNLPAWLAHYK